MSGESGCCYPCIQCCCPDNIKDKYRHVQYKAPIDTNVTAGKANKLYSIVLVVHTVYQEVVVPIVSAKIVHVPPTPCWKENFKSLCHSQSLLGCILCLHNIMLLCTCTCTMSCR